MKNLLLLSGSLRTESWNTRFLEHLSKSCSLEKCHIEWLRASDLAWPLFNEDLENDLPLQTQVMQIANRLLKADALIIASPEYNGMVTPFLKNVVDWTSRMPHIQPDVRNAFLDKPVLLCAASTGGSGGVTGLSSARSLMAYLGACVFGQTITLPHAHLQWTEAGFWFESETQKIFDDALQRFVQFSR